MFKVQHDYDLVWYQELTKIPSNYCNNSYNSEEQILKQQT
jgi:hypothetical protein